MSYKLSKEAKEELFGTADGIRLGEPDEDVRFSYPQERLTQWIEMEVDRERKRYALEKQIEILEDIGKYIDYGDEDDLPTINPDEINVRVFDLKRELRRLEKKLKELTI